MVIRDLSALYGEPATDDAQLANEEEPDDGDDSFKRPRKGRKHRRPSPSPDPRRPPTDPTPPRAPPPPPPGSNRTTPDIYNTTTLTSTFHDAYHPLSTLYDFMDELERTYAPRVKVITLGMSAEGREIRGVKIHKPREGVDAVVQEEKGRRVRGKGRKKKSVEQVAEEQGKEIYIQGGQHAREVRTTPPAPSSY